MTHSMMITAMTMADHDDCDNDGHGNGCDDRDNPAAMTVTTQLQRL